MILGIIQARVSSTRLPGKVLMPILEKPMLSRQIERVRRAQTLTTLAVATSFDPADDRLEDICVAEGVECFRGSLDDVLDRFRSAALHWRADHVVRLTGDCPLADPAIIDAVVRFHLEGEFDYTSNTIEPTFPDGLDVEVVRTSVLDAAWSEARRRAEREHVTLWIYSRPERFRLGSFRAECDLSSLRWTVDEPADFEFVSAVYEQIYRDDPRFGMPAVLALMERQPHLRTLNASIKRNEGLQRSLRDDLDHAEG